MGYELDNETEELLDSAKQALDRGRKDEARDFLERVIEKNQYHEGAWFMMTKAVETEDELRICLENVLEINPDHAEARRQMNALDGVTDDALFDDSLFGDFDPFTETEDDELPDVVVDEAEGPGLAERVVNLQHNRRVLVALMVLLGLGFLLMSVVAILLATGTI